MHVKYAFLQVSYSAPVFVSNAAVVSAARAVAARDRTTTGVVVARVTIVFRAARAAVERAEFALAELARDVVVALRETVFWAAVRAVVFWVGTARDEPIAAAGFVARATVLPSRVAAPAMPMLDIMQIMKIRNLRTNSLTSYQIIAKFGKSRQGGN
jgi:hypothetical protein